VKGRVVERGDQILPAASHVPLVVSVGSSHTRVSCHAIGRRGEDMKRDAVEREHTSESIAREISCALWHRGRDVLVPPAGSGERVRRFMSGLGGERFTAVVML
jgi:hypothetical protein